MAKEYGYKDSRFSEMRRDAMHRVRGISMHRAAYALCHQPPTILHSIAW